MPAENFRSKVDAWLLAVMGTALPLWILTTTHYKLDDRTLSINSGPVHWQVSLAKISAVILTRNPLSSPALSLDRLQIQYGSG